MTGQPAESAGTLNSRRHENAGGIFIRIVPQNSDPIDVGRTRDAGGIFIRIMPQNTDPIDAGRRTRDAGGIFIRIMLQNSDPIDAGRIRDAGGSRIYVDTSQRAQYASTRAFYENAGYKLDAVLAEFYAPGDNKVIYCKSL